MTPLFRYFISSLNKRSRLRYRFNIKYLYCDDPVFAKNLDSEVQGEIALKQGAIRSLIIFGIAVLAVVLLGSFPGLLPDFAGKAGSTPNFAVNDSGQVMMPAMIMMFLITALCCQV